MAEYNIKPLLKKQDILDVNTRQLGQFLGMEEHFETHFYLIGTDLFGQKGKGTNFINTIMEPKYILGLPAANEALKRTSPSSYTYAYFAVDVHATNKLYLNLMAEIVPPKGSEGSFHEKPLIASTMHFSNEDFVTSLSKVAYLSPKLRKKLFGTEEITDKITSISDDELAQKLYQSGMASSKSPLYKSNNGKMFLHCCPDNNIIISIG